MRRKFYTVLRNNTKSLAIFSEQTEMVPLQEQGAGLPFFIVDSYPYFIDVVKLMGTTRPVLSLVAQQETHRSEAYSIVDEAAAHLKAILEYQPRGPYLLGGCSASGIVAYEIAQQLKTLGREVGLLVVFDTPNPYFVREYSRFWMMIASHKEELRKLRQTETRGWILEIIRRATAKQMARFRLKSRVNHEWPVTTDQLGPLPARITAARRYRPAPYSGRFLLVKRARDLVGRYLEPTFGWSKVIRGKIDICKVSASDHLEIFKCDHDRELVAEALTKNISEVVDAPTVPFLSEVAWTECKEDADRLRRLVDRHPWNRARSKA